MRRFLLRAGNCSVRVDIGTIRLKDTRTRQAAVERASYKRLIIVCGCCYFRCAPLTV